MAIIQVWIKEIKWFGLTRINLGGKIIEKEIKIWEEYLLNNVNQTTKGIFNLIEDWLKLMKW